MSIGICPYFGTDIIAWIKIKQEVYVYQDSLLVISMLWFKESDQSVRFVILEAAGLQKISQSRLVPVDIVKSLAVIEETCPLVIFCKLLGHFLLMEISLHQGKSHAMVSSVILENYYPIY